MSKGLIDGKHAGILTTVDGHGHPHARWMATLAFDDFPYIYTLTSSTSRKLSHIANQPTVAWMFSSEDLGVVLNLAGPADIVVNLHEQKRIWEMVSDKSHAYFLKQFGSGSEYTVLKTTVRQIECCIPEKNAHWQIDVQSFLDLARES
ncbi:hypothetical protein BH09VER1_BH09VER1_15020 [soil metagenome]